MSFAHSQRIAEHKDEFQLNLDENCSDRTFNVSILAQYDPLIAKNKSQNSLERETIIHILFELKTFGFLLHIHLM